MEKLESESSTPALRARLETTKAQKGMKGRTLELQSILRHLNNDNRIATCDSPEHGDSDINPDSSDYDGNNTERGGSTSGHSAEDGNTEDPRNNLRIRLRNDALFELHGEVFETHIRKGVAKLQNPETKRSKPVSSRIIEYRQNKIQSLDEIFDRVAAETTSSDKKMQWTFATSSALARALARKVDRKYAQSGVRGSTTEQELMRHEKLPHIIYYAIDALVLQKGVDALLLYAALQEQHCLFSAAKKNIPFNNLFDFGVDIAKRLQDLELTEIGEDTLVYIPLAVVAWAFRLRINLHEKSDDQRHAAESRLDRSFHIPLKDLRHMANPMVQNQVAEISSPQSESACAEHSVDAGWPTISGRCRTGSISDENDTSSLEALANVASQTYQAHYEGDSGCGGSTMPLQFSMAMSAIPVPFQGSETTRDIRANAQSGVFNDSFALLSGGSVQSSSAMRGATRIIQAPGNNSTRRADPATDAGASPGSPHDAGARSSCANGSQIAECIREVDAVVPGSLFLPSQPSTDSGYASNVGSQQVYGTTSVASSSGPFLFETEGGGERVRAAAGQKRPQVGDNATSKRHRPCAAEIMETTENSEAGIEPSNADRTLAIEETPGLGVFASSLTAYNDNRDNGESNASNDFSALVPVESFATAPNAPVEVNHTPSYGAPGSAAGGPNISFRHTGQSSSLNLDLTGSQSNGPDLPFEGLDMDDVPNWASMGADSLVGIDLDDITNWNPLAWNFD
ncbi:hypothetical protein G3M48_008766 [Beauveria asiatica]|uniref:C6 transcription factor n=1 Tax=Beauveria asiatica TaxID=1069075 RepID=A0AAW0RJS1_9HYPO